MTNSTETIPSGCLGHAGLAEHMGWASSSVARTMSSRARKRRERGAARPGDLPAPDGYAGQAPYWRKETIAEWNASRPSTIRTEDVGEGQKRCTRCKEVKPLAEFHTYLDKRADPPEERPVPKCKPCATSAALEWLNENPEQRRAANAAYVRRPEVKRRKRARKYGLTVEDLAAMEAAQDGRCLICGKPEEVLVVDHCHTTGKVRGLLCGLCNVGLGAFKDRPNVLAAALAYLISSAA